MTNNPTSTTTSFYLRSSLTGNLIAQYDAAGVKQNGYVYAGKQLLVQQQRIYDGSTRTMWQHVNPIIGDGLSTDAQGVVLERTNVDPRGVNVGDEDPFISNEPTNGGEGEGYNQAAIDAMVASLFPGFGGPTCKVDGAFSLCHIAFGLLGMGAADFGPSQTTIAVYSRSLGKYVGLATWNPNQAAAGVSVFGLPTGWSINGMNFTGNGFTFSSTFPIGDMMKIYGNLGAPGLGGYLGELVQQGYGSLGQLSEAYGPFGDRQDVLLRAPMDSSVLNAVDELMQKPTCSKFLNGVLAELAKASGRGRDGVTFESLFNAARGSIFSANPWPFPGSASPDGILVGNPAFHIEILMRDEVRTDRSTAPTRIMHEVFHGAPSGGDNYTHTQMVLAAITVAEPLGDL
ncbi:MAG TPA: hypothetical protein VN696_14040 [Pyrinomonadaceae bacterium]|nr:hypothetical protein [Pyrinomonadaceae bacterium]